MDKVLELWQNYCIGRTNVIYERYKFNNRSQEANEQNGRMSQLMLKQQRFAHLPKPANLVR